MSSNPPNNKPVLRVTGDGSIFLDRVAQAATKKIADATQQRSDVIGKANSDASAKLAEAHRTAAEILQPKPEALYALTDQGLFRSDPQGKCAPPLATGAASSFVIDQVAQRIYWSELRQASNPGSPVCPQPLQVALYSASSYQGEPRTFVSPALINDPGYTYFKPIVLNSFPQGFKIGSVRLARNTILTVYEKPDCTGRVRVFTDDDENVSSDWPLDGTTSITISDSYCCLMSARLDGTDRTEIALLPNMNPAVKAAGALALDSGRGLLFWLTPSGHLMKVDFSGGVPVVIFLFNDLVTGFTGLTIDTVNQNLYWSFVEEFGTFQYGGPRQPWDPTFRTMGIQVSMQLSPMPLPLPSDWFTFARPAVSIALDQAHNRIYFSNGQKIWRTAFDGSILLPEDGFSPNGRDAGIYILFAEWASVWGLVLDQPSQMLYWLAGSDLWQMSVDPSLSHLDVTLSAKKLFTFQGLAGHGVDLALFGSTDVAVAKQLVKEAHGRQQAAQNQAPLTIDEAQKTAADTRQTAQTKLDDAHVQAVGDISKAQQTAATNRQKAQTDAQPILDQVNQEISDANAKADGDRATANTNAPATISKKQTEADSIRSEAQAQLDQARQKLQNT
jgi:hypothetical protein